MHVFILGATGTIGSAVTKELRAYGHEVSGLCRSEDSANQLRSLGASFIAGDLRQPEDWADRAISFDCVIQLAATFDDDMGDVDCGVLDALEQSARQTQKTVRILYTGGCWLYGATGDAVVDEETPFKPIEPFAWMVENASRLERSPFFQATVLHPAMVYHENGGAFARYIAQAQKGKPVEIWGSAETHWPLVHRDDLAVAYRILAENPEMLGHYNVSAEVGRETGNIAAVIANAFGNNGTYVTDPLSVLTVHGAWAEGPMLDQRMSSEKLISTGLWQPQFTDFESLMS